MIRWQTKLQCGVALGLALLFCDTARADENLRERIHREYKHQSYMLIEGPDGSRLFLFSSGGEPARMLPVTTRDELLKSAFGKTRSEDSRMRTLGLTELAGVSDPEALNVALSLISDPVEAVRNEAYQLILDHPQGASLVESLGLVDEDEED